MPTSLNLQEKIFALEQTIEDKNQLLEDKNRLLEQQNHYISRLEEALKQQRQKSFGASSEKVSPDQLGLFNEAEHSANEHQENELKEEASEITVATHTRQRKPRVSIPADLPRENRVYDLSESEKVCPHDGAALKMIGSDDHEQLDIIPAQIKVIRHQRLKYACPCCHQHVVTARKPKQPIEKSIASPGLLAFVATQKYCDALPLYRQSEMFKRIGVTLDRTNLANWMVKCGTLIQPLINLLRDQLLERKVVHMDETTLQVLNEPGKSAQSQSYLWLMASFGERPICLYHYADSRSQQVPLGQLSSSVTALMVDGYQGYQSACDQYKITRLGCWAHARRQFVQAQKLQPKGKTGKPDQALAFIQKLYQIEKKTQHDSPNQRYVVRQAESKPIIDKIQQWLQKSLLHVPPKTALGKALQYLHNQWDRLIAYLDDGAYPMDNNLAENAIRPFVVGRKNWLCVSRRRHHDESIMLAA